MNILVVYDSMTGNVKRFISKLKCPSIQISDTLQVNQPYILVTYTIGFGQVPSSTKEFLKRNSIFLFGVASSGNKNWGQTYAKAASVISNEFNVPIIHTFELSGTVEDVKIFKEEVEKICQRYQNGSNTIIKS
jgi:protein involved in ribonucleotide reduction